MKITCFIVALLPTLYSYSFVADALSMNKNTVKAFYNLSL